MRKEDHLLRQLVEDEKPALNRRHAKAIRRLQKHELVIRKNGTYQLTPRGREASRVGARNFLRLEKTNYRGQERKWVKRSFYISLFFLLLFGLYIVYVLVESSPVITS